MLSRTAYLPWVGLLVLVVLANGALVSPAHASGKTAKILAGLAVGALVYSALDSDRGTSSSRQYNYGSDRGQRGYTPPPNPRYDPPSRYSQRGHWESPRQTYDRGYSDGWGDGYGYGKSEGRREGYNRGYGHGYGDGRHDQWVADKIGPPYRRGGGRYAEKSYGGYR